MIYKYIIIGIICIGTLSNVALIGEERKPVTRGTAVLGIIFSALEILAIVLYWK